MKDVIRGVPVTITFARRMPRGWRRDTRGDCRRLGAGGYAIRVLDELDDGERLEVLLHELLHAAYWDLDEEAVQETAADIARILQRAGWNRQHPKP